MTMLRHCRATCNQRAFVPTKSTYVRVSNIKAPRAFDDGAGGVQDLLARDWAKKKKSQPVQSTEPAQNVEAKTSVSSAETEVVADDVKKGDATVLKSRKSRREEMAKNADSTTESSSNRPKRCRDAIERGLEFFTEKKYLDAIAMFNLALELPGNAAYRLPGSPREYLCPSDAEEQSVMYNMACAYAALGQKEAAVTCIEAALDGGFEDYETIRTDPDLAVARSELNALLFRYDNPIAKASKLFRGKQSASDNKAKPWIMW